MKTTLSLTFCALLLAGCGSSSSGSSTQLQAGSTASGSSGAPVAALRAVAVHSELWRNDESPAQQPEVHVLVSGAPANALSLEVDRGQGYNDTGLVAVDHSGFVEFVLPASRPPVALRVRAGAQLSNEVLLPVGGFPPGHMDLVRPIGTYLLDVTRSTSDATLGWNDLGAESYLLMTGSYTETLRTSIGIYADFEPEAVAEVDGSLRSWLPGAAARTTFLAPSGGSLRPGLKGAVVYALDASGWAVRHDTDGSPSPSGRLASALYTFRLR
ncbi:MAG: hypothetical protein R3F62_04105 [Planctomycetota bacterium]